MKVFHKIPVFFEGWLPLRQNTGWTPKILTWVFPNSAQAAQCISHNTDWQLTFKNFDFTSFTIFTCHIVHTLLKGIVSYDPSIVKQFSCRDIVMTWCPAHNPVVAEPKSKFWFLQNSFCCWCCPFWCCKSCPPGHFPILWLQTFIIKTRAQRASTFCKYFTN